MGLLIFFMTLALSVSFLCSIMEAVILSVTPTHATALEQAGDPLGRRLRLLKDDIDRPLAAILSLNTVANTAGAAGVGAQAAHVFGDGAVGLVSAVLTLLILVFSEIIPKTLGAAHWRRLTPSVVRLLIPLMWIMFPFVKLSRVISRAIAPGAGSSDVSRADLSALAELGAEQGLFLKGESRILDGFLRFGSLRAEDIMTPRTVVVTLNEEETVGDVMDRLAGGEFSRIPVHRGSLDEVSGYVLWSEIVQRALAGATELHLTELRRELTVVPASLPLPLLFERLLETRAMIVLVVDEYGGSAGVVTMEDLIETLLGEEIVDEVDRVEDMQELARRQRSRRAEPMGGVHGDTPPRGEGR